MATLVVKVEIPNRNVERCLDDGIISDNGEIAVVDEAYLKRWYEDDSFFEFQLVEALDTPVEELKGRPIRAMTGEDFMRAIEEGVRRGMELRGE